MMNTEAIIEKDTVENSQTKVVEIYEGNFECNYKTTNNETEYRMEFLRAFKLTEYKEDVLIDKQNCLCKILCEDTNFKNLLGAASSKASRLMMSPEMESDYDFGLMILFSYDYFNLYHECLREYMNQTETMNDSVLEKINNLRELIKNE